MNFVRSVAGRVDGRVEVGSKAFMSLAGRIASKLKLRQEQALALVNHYRPIVRDAVAGTVTQPQNAVVGSVNQYAPVAKGMLN